MGHHLPSHLCQLLVCLQEKEAKGQMTYSQEYGISKEGTNGILSGACDFQWLDENVAFFLRHLKGHGEIEQDPTNAIQRRGHK